MGKGPKVPASRRLPQLVFGIYFFSEVLPLMHFLARSDVFPGQTLGSRKARRITLTTWINQKTKRFGAATVRPAMGAGLARLRYLSLPIE